MSNMITVEDFKWIPGKNDQGYIKLLQKALDRYKQITNKALAKIKELSADPWIPVTEGLPEEHKEVLVTYDFRGHRSLGTASMYHDKSFHGYDDEYLTPDGRKYRKVVAWMNLPDPWKGDIGDYRR